MIAIAAKFIKFKPFRQTVTWKINISLLIRPSVRVSCGQSSKQRSPDVLSFSHDPELMTRWHNWLDIHPPTVLPT